MSHLKYNKLSIDGQIFEGSALQHYCSSKLKDVQSGKWEIPIYEFISEWLKEKEYVIVNTSGSTGEPKSIRLKKQYMINSAFATAKALGLKSGQTALLALSAKYIAGKMMIVRSMVIGLNLILVEPSGNPLEKIDKKIDFTALVPLQLSSILKSKNHIPKLQRIKYVLIGGGAIEESLIQKISTFPNDFYGSYGMTETCTHIALRRLNGESPDKYYKALPGVKISADQRSCLVIDAPHLNENRLITNDLVTIISDTAFSINGRIDHIINTGGVKISPEKVEGKLKGLIHDNFIITSTPDNQFGEKIILVIERNPSNLSKLPDLWKQIEFILNPFEKPKSIEFISSFTYTPTGKIDRNAMKEIIRRKLNIDF